jgi:hypothetical protein
VEKKSQHVIPECYLKSWCDPKSLNQPLITPYIWRISRDGSKKTKKSPENSFVSNDHYTITLPNGERNLVVEDTLAGLENNFVQVLPKIYKREPIGDVDRAHLILFTAAMHSRSETMGDWFKKTQTELHEAVVTMEKMHSAPPSTSLMTQKYIDHANPLAVAMLMKAEAPTMAGMEMSILVTNDPLGFITSDTPVLWFNPEAYKWPPFYRSPGLLQGDIEVSLPLTPQHILLIWHKKKFPFYMDVGQKVVDEANRQRRIQCSEEFVSWKGETRPYWFEILKMPADAWENTEEGKKALAEAAVRKDKNESHSGTN